MDPVNFVTTEVFRGEHDLELQVGFPVVLCVLFLWGRVLSVHFSPPGACDVQQAYYHQAVPSALSELSIPYRLG